MQDIGVAGAEFLDGSGIAGLVARGEGLGCDGRAAERCGGGAELRQPVEGVGGILGVVGDDNAFLAARADRPGVDARVLAGRGDDPQQMGRPCRETCWPSRSG